MTSGIIALFIASFLSSAISPLFVKLGVGEIPPITFTFFRFLIATLVILPFYLKHGGLKITKSNAKWIFIDSAFFASNMAFFSIGIQYTNVVISQILYAFAPIIVALLGHFLLSEKITFHKALGSAIAFSGLMFLISQSFSGLQNTFGTPLGNLIVMIAVFSWSFYIIISRKITHSYSQISISFANFFITMLILAIFVPFELSARSFSILNISHLGLISLLVVGIFSSVVYINLLQFGIKKTNAFIASLFSYMGPLAAAITAVPFLGEKITLNLVLGGLLIIAGVFYATTYTTLGRYLKSRN